MDRSLIGSRLKSDVVVVDVGARWGVGERWRAFGPRVHVVGFDPDEAECARLGELEPDVDYVARALSATSGLIQLHETAEPACSSVFPPAVIPTRDLPDLAGLLPVREINLVEATTLDLWLEASRFGTVHALKLDTQGSELDILRGGEAMLEGVRMLEVEVEFNELYTGQPLFGDIDAFLRERGFVLWRLTNLVHYGFDGADASAAAVQDIQHFDSAPVSLGAHGGQLYWGHAYFIAADMIDIHTTVSATAALADACVALGFGFEDLARMRLRAAGIHG